MYQTVTRGPMQLPTSLEPWLNAKAKVLSDKVFQIQLDPIWIQIPERTKAGSEQLKGPEHPLHLLLLLLHLLHLLLPLQGLLLLVPVDHREGSREPLLAVQKVFNFDCFACWNTLQMRDVSAAHPPYYVRCCWLRDGEIVDEIAAGQVWSPEQSLITWTTKLIVLTKEVDRLDKIFWVHKKLSIVEIKFDAA